VKLRREITVLRRVDASAIPRSSWVVNFHLLALVFTESLLQLI